MNTVETVKDFIGYLKKPYYKRSSDRLVPLIPMLNVFFIVLFLNFFLFLPVVYLLGLDEQNHMMDDLIKNTSKLKLFFLAVILAPLIEEFVFRFHLRYRPLMLVFCTICGLALVGYGIFSILGIENIFGSFDFENLETQQALDFSTFNMTGIMTIGLLTMIGFLIIILVLSQKKWMDGFGEWTKNNYFLIFYLSAFIFGIAHVSNWKDSDVHFLLAPLMVLPQLLLALYLGYIRVKNDIWSSIFVHGFNNLIPVAMIIVAELLDIKI